MTMNGITRRRWPRITSTAVAAVADPRPSTAGDQDEDKGNDDDADDDNSRSRSIGYSQCSSGGISSSSSSSSLSSHSPSGRFNRDSVAWQRQASVSTITASRSSHLEETPHELAARVAERVKVEFHRELPDSLVEDYDERDVVAPFRTEEIVLGPYLGSGEFSNVYEIKGFRPYASLEIEIGDNDGDDSMGDKEISARRRMKSQERYHDSKKTCRYAVKHLKPDLAERYGRAEYAQSARREGSSVGGRIPGKFAASEHYQIEGH